MKVVVVMPARNAEATLEKTVRDIPKGSVDAIVLVDDVSTDRTAEIARRLGLRTIVLPERSGYGGNQKRCYDEALAAGADIIVMVHPDYQYDSRLLPYIIGFVRDGVCDVILGSRIRTRGEALASGMPVYKYFANRVLTLVENLVLGLNLSECHTGYRAYRREVLERVPYRRFADGFVFDSEFLVAIAALGYRIADVPVPCRYFDEASQIRFRESVRYGLGTLGVLAAYLLHRARIRRDPRFLPR
ncbi:MAG: glycosyltransferase family 2 protein [Candidatus Eisenbacteria bacterium]